MVLKLLISIAIILLMVLAGIKVAAELNYSYKSETFIDGEKFNCYFNRGWFNLPGAKICSKNKSIVITRGAV